MDSLIVSSDILEKIKEKHSVERREVEQCFANREGALLEDNREKHKTNPPTKWFISKTNCNRSLKVVFIDIDGKIHLKSAFEPNEIEFKIYLRYGF